MQRKLLAALAVATTVAALSTPAWAHHPRSIWYHGYKYYLSDYYSGNCFKHHGYYYCRRGGGGGSSGY